MKITKDVHAWAAARNAIPWKCFARNGRWGTCASCPRTRDGDVFPEFCEHTGRYDHQLTLRALTESHQKWLDEGQVQLDKRGYILG
jgi:hypothetical protein